MNDIARVDRRKKWFVWGMLLTGMSSVPVAIGLVYSHRLASAAKPEDVTGAAAGFAEVYSVFGLLLAFLLPFAAIILLAKSLAEEERTRRVLSIICICWGAIMMAIPAWVIWFTIAQHVEH